MPGPTILDIDFSQLRTLQTVFRLNSFSAAAEELSLTQSSVSYAVNRLREAFNDPLFVRQGGTIAATERCAEIVAAASRMLEEIDGLAQPTAFDPGQSTGTVTISCNAYERMILIPPLVRRMRCETPGLKLDILTAFTKANRHLLEGAADLAITPVAMTDSGIYGERLISDRYVCMLDANNPLAAAHLDAPAYLAARHVVVSYGGAWRSPYRVELERLGHRIETTVSTPSLGDLPALLTSTDLVATVPGRLARVFQGRALVTACPFPAPFDIHLYWAARSNRSPLTEWFRRALREIAADSVAEHP